VLGEERLRDGAAGPLLAAFQPVLLVLGQRAVGRVLQLVLVAPPRRPVLGRDLADLGVERLLHHLARLFPAGCQLPPQLVAGGRARDDRGDLGVQRGEGGVAVGVRGREVG